MDTVYNKKSQCCGCSCCADICPVNAIEMKQDREGFLYPIIDHNKCIDCKLCIKTCDFKNKKRKNKLYKPDTYIFQYFRREESQSGGAFVALSDILLKDNGVVYGCVLKDNIAIHLRADTFNKRDKMRESKYVQSDTRHVCKKIEDDLKNGKKVLFTGTPCQAAGVRNYFRNNSNRDNLYIIDFVCHGVPSPMVFSKYIDYLYDIENGKIEKYKFKDKSIMGWGGIHEESYVVDGIYKTNHIWRDIFYDNVAVRECCANCPYTTVCRVSDITIADAWQIEKRDPDMADKIGTSLVMVHNDKGKELFVKINDNNCNKKKVDIDDYMQVNMFMPTSYNKKWRTDFLEGCLEDFESALSKYYSDSHFNKYDQYKVKIVTRINKIIYRGLLREFQFLRRNAKKHNN